MSQKMNLKKSLGKLFLIVLLLYSVGCIGLYSYQEKIVFIPMKGEPRYTPANLGYSFENLRLKSGEEEINAWFIPAQNARATVLFCHGNAGNLEHRLATIKIWHELGVNLMIFDYKGYGSSTGKPSEEGLYEDAQVCHKWLMDNKKIKLPLIIHGRSLGGGVAAWVANNLVCDGLILESTFTSIPDMGAHYYPYLPIRWLSKIYFENLEQVKKTTVPLLVFHGQEDEVIPYEMGVTLAKEGKGEFVDLIGDHNNGFEISPKYIPALGRFIQQLSE